MTDFKGFILCAFLTVLVAFAEANPRDKRTPLNNKNHKCVAESLRETEHYICDDENNMICLPGWSGEDDDCRLPICSFRTSKGSKKGCSPNGECVRPNTCACEVGWEGEACDRCIVMPGCYDGYCDDAFDCICRNSSRYTGAACDNPVCREGCKNGYCVDPGECICQEGYSGELCDQCMPLPGCQHGGCKDNPLECVCDEGWTGSLCDCPVCREGCNMDHGFCINTEGHTNECLCYPGWKGANCTECVPYPGCPAGGTCNEPWDCNCPEGVTGGVCGISSKYNTLPDFYHHQMSATCCQMNRLFWKGGNLPKPEVNTSPFGNFV